MTFKTTKDEQEVKSGLPDLQGLPREQAQRVLKMAFDNFDKSVGNLYTHQQPNQNLTDLGELMDLCDRYGVSTCSPDSEATARGRAESEQRAVEEAKAETRKEIRKLVARGELPQLPPLPPKDYGANKVLAQLLRRRAENAHFDSFYGVN